MRTIYRYSLLENCLKVYKNGTSLMLLKDGIGSEVYVRRPRVVTILHVENTVHTGSGQLGLYNMFDGYHSRYARRQHFRTMD